MADKKLECVPGSVEIFCYGKTTVRIKTSDLAAGKKISALGDNTSVATVTFPDPAVTDSTGCLDVTVECSGSCPNSTKITFDSPEYKSDSVDVSCKRVQDGMVAGTDDLSVAIVPIRLSTLHLERGVKSIPNASTAPKEG